MRHWTVGWAALALLVAGAAPACADNIVMNGGFETGNFSGWTVTGDHVTVASGTSHGGVGPHTGTYFAALGTEAKLGSLSQVLNTTPGQMYTLDYFLANDGKKPNTFKVEWNGATLVDKTGIGKHGYIEHTFQVMATSATTTLSFFERNDPGYLSLDDVKVIPTSAAPEPATLPLLGLGALGLGGYAGLRRRRKLQLIEA